MVTGTGYSVRPPMLPTDHAVAAGAVGDMAMDSATVHDTVGHGGMAHGEVKGCAGKAALRAEGSSQAFLAYTISYTSPSLSLFPFGASSHAERQHRVLYPSMPTSSPDGIIFEWARR